MLAFTLRFPLGVYHALAPRPDRHDAAEWAPHPTRLIGALLAAAHEVPSADVDGDRAVLQRLCEAPPPLVYAPPSAPWDDPTPRPFATVAELMAELNADDEHDRQADAARPKATHGIK